ncbi:MAG: calcium-binding protein [Pseudomonadota bacterium]
MKSAFWVIGVGTAVLLGGAALAQDRGAKLFEKVDANGDGRITQGEAAEFRAARFARMDENGDGALTLAEIQSAAKRRVPERAAKRFEKMDGNGDGAVTRTEFDDRARARFSRMDANGDGALTREEVKALKDRRRGG